MIMVNISLVCIQHLLRILNKWLHKINAEYINMIMVNGLWKEQIAENQNYWIASCISKTRMMATFDNT